MDISKTTFGSCTLHPHQIAATQWMMEREKDPEVPGGFLCDEMGLGKTITTVALTLLNPKQRCLILCPLPVIGQWIKAFAMLKGPAAYELTSKGWTFANGSIQKGRIFITNYEKLLSQKDKFSGHFDRVICDEAHNLRNAEGSKRKAVGALSRDLTWLLTGTPIVNNKKEFLTLASLIDSKLSVTKPIAFSEMCEWMKRHALGRKVDHLREHFQDVLPKPAKITQHRLPFASEKEAKFYRGIQGLLSAEIDHMLEQEHPDMISILNSILALRQISVHPQIYISAKKRRDPTYNRAEWIEHSTKVEAILKILNESKQSHGFVIFCNFKEEIALLESILKKQVTVGTVLSYHGALSEKQRMEVVAESERAMEKVEKDSVGFLPAFLRSKTNVDCARVIEDFVGPKHVIFLAQIQCAGTGINLQHMDRVIFTTPWWTAALMDQAAGRVLRLGQKKQVEIHHIALDEELEFSLNIDDYMNERVEQKRELCNLLLEAANHRIFPVTPVKKYVLVRD